jgi:hypothetical protein
MSNKYCGPDIVKKIIVAQPVNIAITGSTGNLYVCSGTTFVNTISGCTGDVNLNGSIFSNDGSASFNTISACTGVYTSNLFGCSPITVHDDIIPNSDDTINLGTPIRRFRNINTVSGTSTIWTSTQEVNTPNLNLGLDGDNNQRIITANNSVIQDDILSGGLY